MLLSLCKIFLKSFFFFFLKNSFRTSFRHSQVCLVTFPDISFLPGGITAHGTERLWARSRYPIQKFPGRMVRSVWSGQSTLQTLSHKQSPARVLNSQNSYRGVCALTAKWKHPVLVPTSRVGSLGEPQPCPTCAFGHLFTETRGQELSQTRFTWGWSQPRCSRAGCTQRL